MLTDGLTAMLTKEMAKDEGSVETLLHVMVFFLETSMAAMEAGWVTWRAATEATRAARMEALKNCILTGWIVDVVVVMGSVRMFLKL